MDGSPTVPDKVLAQIVGESIAQAFGDTRSRVSKTEYVIIPTLYAFTIPRCADQWSHSFVTILVAGTYVMFLNAEIPLELATELEDLSPEDTGPCGSESLLYISSTRWFNLMTASGRMCIAQHLLGLGKWAKAKVMEQLVQVQAQAQA